MDYLQLVNKVLDESGKEQNPLDYDSWESAEAGRRLYPRVKRLVREAWKMLQMKRNEWEFNTGEFVTTIYPKLRFVDGHLDDVDDSYILSVPSVWVGRESGVEITITDIHSPLESPDDWEQAAAVYGQATFTTESTSPPVIGEIFEWQDGPATFEYAGAGSYKLFPQQGRVRKPRWDTVQAKRPGEGYISLMFVPWDQRLLGGLTYGNSTTVPLYFSQDYMGDLVFYSQTLQPFTLSFVYDIAPQSLESAEDEPEGLPEEYHEWIAWEALMNLARFDKDPDLFGYAESMATVYRQRAERNLMPIPAWETSRYDR